MDCIDGGFADYVEGIAAVPYAGCRGATAVTISADRAAAGKGELDQDWRELGRRVRLLRAAPLLWGLPRDQLRVLAALMRPLLVEAGTVLYREGDPATRFFLIEFGTVARRADGVEVLGPGDTFGDAVLWAGSSFRTTATAESRSGLWALDAVELARAREQHRSLDQALHELRPGVNGHGREQVRRDATARSWPRAGTSLRPGGRSSM